MAKDKARTQKHSAIGPALLAASQAALGLVPAQARGETVGEWMAAEDWQTDTALVYYGESDDRVETGSLSARASRQNGDDEGLTLAFKADTLTGATPNGAVPQDRVQTFTRPSGRGSYQIAPGDTPLDDTFKDTRVQLNAAWQAPLPEGMGGGRWQLGTHLSKEYDYLSLGVNGRVSRDFDRNNRTLSLGFIGFYDTVEPEGRIPVPLSTMVLRQDFPNEDEFARAFNQTRGSETDTKITTEAQLGLTQVINATTVMQIGYSFAWVDGYQNDFLKLVSVVDDSGTALQQLYESRPDTRAKHGLFWQGKFHFGGPVLDTQYRFMTDDWSLDSHTLEGRLNWPLGGGHYLEPHLRLYQQDAADFYTPYLTDGDPLPGHASADYRLAELDSWTLGLKYGVLLSEGKELDLRIEYYRQSPENLTGPGQLARFDLNPELEAVIVQLGYRF